jgi:Trp operon repressor
MDDSLHADLYKLLSRIQSDKEVKRLLIDLLSPAEIDNIAERWHIMQEIAAGTSHRAIAKAVGTSIARSVDAHGLCGTAMELSKSVLNATINSVPQRKRCDSHYLANNV